MYLLTVDKVYSIQYTLQIAIKLIYLGQNFLTSSKKKYDNIQKETLEHLASYTQISSTKACNQVMNDRRSKCT